MSALVLATHRTAQPQGPVAVDYSNPLARGLVFAINPAAGGVNLARSNWPSVNTELVKSTSASVLISSGAANYTQSINNANGLTLFSILRSRDASQYLFSDGERSILSARNAINQGWTWSRTGAADIGGSRGNATRQAFTLNGIAAYTEANSTIESFADVPVALRYNKSTGVISWFSNGRKSSNDTSGSTGGTVGGDLVFRRQGPYANNLQPYIDKTGLTLVFERALSDAEISAISANPWQLFKPTERRIWVPASTGGGQTISPPLLTRTKTIYDPLVSVGAVALEPPLLTRSRVLHEPSVSQGGAEQIIAPGLLTRAKTIHSPVLVPGEVDLLPPLLTRTKTIHDPSVSAGATISPALLTRTKTVYGPSIDVGGVTLTPPLLTRGKTIYFPALEGGDIPEVTGGLFWPIVRRRRR